MKEWIDQVKMITGETLVFTEKNERCRHIKHRIRTRMGGSRHSVTSQRLTRFTLMKVVDTTV